MSIFKILSNFFTRSKKVTYDMATYHDSNCDFQDNFTYFDTIKFEKENRDYNLICYFTDDVEFEKKERIIRFIKDGLSRDIELIEFFLYVSFAFNIEVAYKAGKNENDINFYMGDINF